MRFSYWASSEQPWDDILAGAQHAGSTGWDGVWVADHFMPGFGDDTGPHHECWTLLAGLAVAVPEVRLGSLVVGNTYRNPGLLAKMATTVDHLSGGRVVLGLGAGWQENEHRAYGFEYGTVASRLDRLEEACGVITSLLSEERTNILGAHYTFTDAPLAPKPVQPRLPLLIGGGGEQRTLRIVARYADEWNIWGTPEQLAQKGRVLAERCEEIGRDPSEISHSAQALLYLSDDEVFLARQRQKGFLQPTVIGSAAEVADIVGRYQQAGVEELIIPDFNLRDLERRRDTMDRFMTEVAVEFR